MGEEEKKPEEKKTEEKKTEETKTEDKKTEEKKAEEPKATPPEKAAAAAPPAPPPEIVLRVFMHCEGCARKVRRCLKGFQGVEDVETDCKTQKVVVKGAKADPLAVLERVKKKSHRHVELLSPIPPTEDPKKPEEKVVDKPPDKKEEPQVITAVMKVHMHCEACAQEIRRRILKMSGVEEVEPDLKSSQVTVKGIFDPSKLVEYVHKRTGKHASIIVKEEPHDDKKEKEEKEKEKEKGKDEKKADDKAGTEKKKDGGDDVAVAAPPAEGEEVAGIIDMKKNEFYYNYPQNYQINPYPQRYEMHPYQQYSQYPPQMFSDENPNACSVM